MELSGNISRFWEIVRKVEALFEFQKASKRRFRRSRNGCGYLRTACCG
jgi:hypothetical protein